MSKRWYPQAALSGFCRGISARMGVSVEISAGQPCTDGKTVYLPPITEPLTDREFLALCGTAVHEAAHVLFQSVPQHVAFAAGDSLRALCFNIMLDVADESRVEQMFAGVDNMLRTGNEDAMAKILGGLSHGTPHPNLPWLIGVMGIGASRRGLSHSQWCDFERYLGSIQKSGERCMVTDARRIAWMLRKKAVNKVAFGKTPTAKRTRQLWNRLWSVAEDIYQILKEYPQPPQGQSSMFGQGGGTGAGIPASAQGGKPAPGDKIVTSGEGVLIGEGKAVVGQGGTPGGSVGGDGQAFHDTGDNFNEPLYIALRSGISGAIARMLETQHAEGDDQGYLSGPKLGRDLTRAHTDGRVFARRVAEGEQLHAAVLMDVSDSMSGELGGVGAVSEAFAVALKKSASSVSLYKFADHPTQVSSFRQIHQTEGGTGTGRALQEAWEAVSAKRGRRIVVVVTDGAPSGMTRVHQMIRQIHKERGEVIGVGYGTCMKEATLRQCFPGCEIAWAANPSQLGLVVGQIAKRIASRG